MNESQAQHMKLPDGILEQYTDEQKRAILKSNGWQTLWSEHYWVKCKWFNNPGVNVDWAGMDTDRAFIQCLKELEYKREYMKWMK